MSRFTRILMAAIFAFIFANASTTFAQTFDGQTPAMEIDCDNFSGAAYGLCVAYCEAQDCDVNTGQPSCNSLRKNFQKKTGSDQFPCDPRCGDGVVNQANEQCDDGNDINCDGCSMECEIQEPSSPECGGGGFPGCDGATCGTFIPCNAGSTCGFTGVCGTSSVDGVTAGPGFCVDGSTSCAELTLCPNGQSDCGANETCFINSCCVDPVCVPNNRFCSEPGL